MLRLTGGNIPQAVNDLLCFCFVLFISSALDINSSKDTGMLQLLNAKECCWHQRLRKLGEGGGWGGLWVGTLWDWLSISSCRHYQLAKIGNLFKLLFSHMCTLQKIWISFYYLHFHSRATLSTDTQAVWVRNRHLVKGFSRWKWKHWK